MLGTTLWSAHVEQQLLGKLTHEALPKLTETIVPVSLASSHAVTVLSARRHTCSHATRLSAPTPPWRLPPRHRGHSRRSRCRGRSRPRRARPPPTARSGTGSAKCGHVTHRHAAMDSTTKFHTQCVTNPQMARCDRMASCGTHPHTTMPCPSMCAPHGLQPPVCAHPPPQLCTSVSFTTHRMLATTLWSPQGRPWPTSNNSCLGSLHTRLRPS